ncbi:hypothetical protein [Epilithonimonas mollis]|uniref:Uncharacterized protein n=1 Tax=Epilithonimonas mollis TaxID=216903 RepID=A0A1M6UQN6_9FLAO|nr:hypothetical protein [Epilithonimonas mollis]SHK71479.1 hypothetical protein SAMN05444371_3420 [Epilithonimonas mollis]
MNNVITHSIISEQIDLIPEKINALVSTITMKNGKKSKILTVFDNYCVDFEAIEIGVRRGLEFMDDVDSVASELFSVSENGMRSSRIYYRETKNTSIYKTN